jgi:hypothetical protein
MKICPVRSYSPPKIPLQHERDDLDIPTNSMPDRWQQAAKMLGTCAALQWLLTGCADATPQPTPTEQTAETVNTKTTTQTSVDKQTQATIIDILNEALTNTGRGSFGCVAINPPAFLSEEEALKLIRTEFSKAGLIPDATPPTVQALSIPETETWPEIKRDQKGKPILDKDGKWIPIPLKLHSPEKFTFDLSFNHQQIRIEYISRSDYRDWKKKSNILCSVSSFNFSDVAQRFQESLHQKSNLEAAAYCILFDPLAHPKKRPVYPNTQGFSKKELQLVRKKYYEERKKFGEEASKKQLLLQIQHLLDELESQGLLPPKA